MTPIGKMLFEVVHQRIATAFDDQVLNVLRLELGLFDVDLESPEARKTGDILSRMFRLSWKRLGEDLRQRLLSSNREARERPWLAECGPDEPSS